MPWPHIFANAPGSPATTPMAWLDDNFNAALMASNNLSDVPSPAAARANLGISALLIVRSYLAGLTLSTAGGSSIFGIAAGVAADSANSSMMALATAFTKTTTAWAVGTGAGGLDTGAIANNTWYHVYVIQRTDTGLVDVLFSLNATTPTLPTNYSLYRRIGSMKTDGAAHWIAFIQIGDHFRWVTPVQDVNNVVAGVTTRQSRTLSVPTGLVIEPDFWVGLSSGATPGCSILITSLDETDTTIIQGLLNIQLSSAGANAPMSNVYGIHTNTSAQVGSRVNTTDCSQYLTTYGWWDRRGRDT